jgi:hypothetical protein
VKCLILILFLLLLMGCQAGYQKDRNVRVIHILGIGWIFERCGTNTIRVFGIGSLEAATGASANQTNAPFVMQSQTNTVEK